MDITGIGFYTLGSIRNSLNNEQKIKYEKLFEEYFLKVLLKSEIIFGKEVLNKNYTIVNSLLKVQMKT